MESISPSANMFAEQIQKIKATNSGVITNLYLAADEVKSVFASKDCRLYLTDRTLILSIPYFQQYHDMHYVAATPQHLSSAMEELKEFCPEGHTLRISVVGRDEDTENTVSALCDVDFTQVVRLARMRLKKPKPNVISSMRSLVAEQGEDDRFRPRFAREEDAEAVFHLLAEEFDFCKDSLPEISDIYKHIKDNFVVVIEDNGKIVCAHYFEVKNNIYYGLFDITAREYRNKFLFLRISLFMYDEAEAGRLRTYRRRYGWRDVMKKPLMRFAALNEQLADGIYINNMVWSKNRSEHHYVTT